VAAASSYYNNDYSYNTDYSYGGFPGGYYGAYGGYPGGYYGGGYAHRSYVTGRPTLFPRYYGYAGGNYGGYAHRSYITGRPTLFPRYYGQ
jgi:hypothetical protein